MHTHRLLTSAATLVLLLNICHAQTSVTCHIKTFNAPAGSPLSPLTNAVTINRWGNVVGESHGGPYIRYADGGMQRLPISVPGYPEVHPLKRNANGVTVGYATNTVGQSRAFSYLSGTTTVFSVNGYTVVGLAGINRYGTLVGHLKANGSEAVGNGFVYKNGKLSKLSIPVAHRVTAISDTGVIVGDYVNSTNPQPFDNVHGFVFAGGLFLDFSVPWAATTFITDINASGMIVGVTEGPGGNFIYKDGRFFNPKFLLPDGTLTEASIFGVNGYGQITGNARGTQTQPFVGSCTF